MMADRRAFTLQPLVEAGVFEPGENALSCSVGGVEYFADLGPAGEIIFEGQFFKSPSAFSVFVKRKVNPSRKADDGWTSCKYRGEPLSIYRPQLENLLGNEARSGLTASPLRSHTTAPKARSKKRPGRREDSEYGEESSYDDGLEPSVGPGIEHSGRLSPAPHDGNGMADLMTTTTSAPSPRRTRRARVPTKLEDDGTFDEEVSGRQPAKPAWSLNPLQPDMVQLQPYKSDLLTKTFVQCENPECGKWRKVPVSLVDHQGRWVCAMNPDPRYNTCGSPQEYTNEEIDRELYEAAVENEHLRHLSQCARPPLAQCTETEFEEDLYSFLTHRGEVELANDLRNKRINCNNLPIDIFGLYREVIKHGGFVDNERYDDYNRWTGGINFGGKIFPKMKNYTPYNRATSVGNQLLNNYRKFLLNYEICHRSRDLGGPIATPSAVTEQPANSGALAVLADVAGNAREEMEVATQLKAPGQGKPSSSGRARKRNIDDFEEDDLYQPTNGRKRHRGSTITPGETDSQRFILALQKLENSAGRYSPGSLLLAQDPDDLNRHWPVLVMGVSDLPSSIACGACALQPGSGFPLSLAEASSKGRAEEAYPVLVLGTQSMGWVETGSCRRYSQSAGDSALASLPPDANNKGALPPLRSRACSNFLCAQALKVALQLSCYAGNQQFVARQLVRMAGAEQIGKRLLELEGQIPAEQGLSSQSFELWHAWRRAVKRAESAAELLPQVLTLAVSISSGILKRGVTPQSVQEEVQHVLELQQYDAAGQQDTSSYQPFCMGPSALGVDDAISALQESVDWMRLRSYALPASSLPQSSLPTQRVRNGMRPHRDPLKSSTVNTSYDDRGVTPSSPVHQGAPLGLAQKRLMREAEPANSGHSGHTPKAQQVQDMLDINTQSAWEQHHRQESGNLDARLGPMRHQQQQPAQRGGRGNASRLQPVSRDASFGSGSAGCIPEAELGAGASGAPTAGGSSSGRRSPEGPSHHPNFGQGLRTGSFRFQVIPGPGGDAMDDGGRPVETPRYAAGTPFQHRPLGGIHAADFYADPQELVGGNDTDDDPQAPALATDNEAEGSGAAGNPMHNTQEGPKPDSISIGSAQPEAVAREAQAEGGQEPDQEAVGGTGGFTPAGSQGRPSQSMLELMAEGQEPAPAKDAAQHAAPVIHPARPLSPLPLMREV